MFANLFYDDDHRLMSRLVAESSVVCDHCDMSILKAFFQASQLIFSFFFRSASSARQPECLPRITLDPTLDPSRSRCPSPCAETGAKLCLELAKGRKSSQRGLGLLESTEQGLIFLFVGTQPQFCIDVTNGRLYPLCWSVTLQQRNEQIGSCSFSP